MQNLDYVSLLWYNAARFRKKQGLYVYDKSRRRDAAMALHAGRILHTYNKIMSRASMPLIESVAYEHSKGNASYQGLILQSGEFSKYVSTRVSRRYYDAEGMSEMSGAFDDVVQAGFDPRHLKPLLSISQAPVSWKIGEKFAECFLEDNKDAIFPYNDSRDAKIQGRICRGRTWLGWSWLMADLFFCLARSKHQKKKPVLPA